MRRLYDFELSGSCYKVRLFLSFLGLDYEKVPVDFVNKEHKTETYLKLNPFGEIPIFEDDDLRLRDAQAILVYLAKRYDTTNSWYPDNAEAMGKISQWLSTGGGEIMNSAGARLVKILNYQMDLPKLQAGAVRAFEILDHHLADREWVELGQPTIGDIACFPYTALAGEGGIDMSKFKNIARWVERMKGLRNFISMPGIG
ncbi:glutathione S-transferase [Paraburkholderia bannensis]|uniref:Glutathione S-transferase n=1 Tax=Paraburkholderia bannensis TaxID=765414 RepID=A0A7W9WUX1_9BURK|nr:MULTISPECIES: glutathione S-transferase family protein [Paraburkholderia]MBB3259874.1 glutathione S-transferase [Paraburkholderia sp. WP4_3_2]MBB6104816.1 glutathione S-transferase [Paraburkholderia bannensis]